MEFDFERYAITNARFRKTKVSGDGMTGSFRESFRAEWVYERSR